MKCGGYRTYLQGRKEVRLISANQIDFSNNYRSHCHWVAQVKFTEWTTEDQLRQRDCEATKRQTAKACHS